MALDRRLDPLHFRNVHSHSNDQEASSAAPFGPAATPIILLELWLPRKHLRPNARPANVPRKDRHSSLSLPADPAPTGPGAKSAACKSSKLPHSENYRGSSTASAPARAA